MKRPICETNISVRYFEQLVRQVTDCETARWKAEAQNEKLKVAAAKQQAKVSALELALLNAKQQILDLRDAKERVDGCDRDGSDGCCDRVKVDGSEDYDYEPHFDAPDEYYDGVGAWPILLHSSSNDSKTRWYSGQTKKGYGDGCIIGKKRSQSRPSGNLYGRHRKQRRGYGGGSKREPEKPLLWAAVENGDQEMVERLIKGDVNINEQYQGWTPLMKAAEENQGEIIKLLLENHADIDVANRKGRTALSFAAAPSMKRPTAIDALQVLLDNGADPSQKDDRKLTARMRASREKRKDAEAILNDFECMQL